MAAYRAALGELTRHLVDDLDAEVTYVSTCQGVPEYWTDDSLVAATVLESLPGAYRKRVRIDGAFHRPDELVELLGGHDVVVSTRMHGAILSLVAGTPAIAIAYEPKTRALYDRLGLSEWTVGVEALDGEGLAGILRSLLARLPEHRARLSEIVAREYRSAMRSGETVRRALAGEDG